MQAASRTDYWQKLQDELNPAVFVTEWLDLQLMSVQRTINKTTNELVLACVEGVKVLLQARREDRALLERIVTEADAAELIKAEFRLACGDPGLFCAKDASEETARFAIFCYLRVAFAYVKS